MRYLGRALAAATLAAGFVWLAACGSSPTSPKKVSLAGNYMLSSFIEAGSAVPFSSGTLALTDTAYAVDIVFPPGTLPEEVDSGTYVATDSGMFSETSRINPQLPQLSGTYTNVNNLLTVTATLGNVPFTQAWQKK